MRLPLLRRRRATIAPGQFRRHEYKAQWNAISASADEAKCAVTGIVDETIIAESAKSSLAILEQHVGVRPDDVILEIGAGIGRVGEELAPLCREWIGADVSENMVEHIRRRLARFPNVKAIAISGFDLAPLADNSIDLVYCIVVFPHIDEWERYSYILEGMRVLRPGGRMLVDNVNLASETGWKIFEISRSFAPHERPGNISRCSTAQELATYFRRAGFVEIRQAEDDCMIVTRGVKPSASL